MSPTNVARAGKRGNICVGNNVSASFASTFKTRVMNLVISTSKYLSDSFNFEMLISYLVL